MIEITLSCCDDTPETLLAGIETLKNTTQPVNEEYGGARHPTNLMCGKALKVLEHKYEVLGELVFASRQFEVMSANKQTVVEAVIAGQSVEEAAGAAVGFGDKIEKCIHRRPYGSPVDADRSFFDSFVSTFGLPKHHLAIYKAKKIIELNVDDWAEAMAKRAREEVERERESGDETSESTAGEAAKRLALLSEGLGLPQDHLKILETEKLGKAAKARKVRIHAEAEWREAQDCTQPAKVNNASDRVIKSIKAAKVWGIEPSHPDMRTAQKVSNDLRGYAVLLFAEDEVRLKRTRTALGDAEKAAERIEAAIKESIANGCPYDQENLKKALEITQEFRSEEGLRKRTANREKQMAEKAAKEAAKQAEGGAAA